VRRKFDEIVAFAEVERFLDTPVKRYSSGMYVRLAFAVAAHLEPEILIIDEVLAVGDQQFQEKCLGKMQAVSRSGRTVLFVSHNMGAVASLCASAVMLREGRVIAHGPARAVIPEYLKPSNETQLESYRLSTPNGPAQFDSITVGATQQNGVELDEPIDFEIAIRAKVGGSGFFIGLTLLNEQGAPVGAYVSPVRYNLGAGERLRILFSTKTDRLAPGVYRAAFGLYKGGGQEISDMVHGYPSVTIFPHGRDGRSVKVWSSSWGSLMLATDETRL
jgi:lipopolysaccharide transport system ATP-binding protein